MELIIVTLALVALAFWQRSNFLSIVAGIVAIGFGAYWIDSASPLTFIYVIEGVAAIGVGIYLLIDVGMSLLKGDK